MTPGASPADCRSRSPPLFPDACKIGHAIMLANRTDKKPACFAAFCDALRPGGIAEKETDGCWTNCRSEIATIASETFHLICCQGPIERHVFDCRHGQRPIAARGLSQTSRPICCEFRPRCFSKFMTAIGMVQAEPTRWLRSADQVASCSSTTTGCEPKR